MKKSLLFTTIVLAVSGCSLTGNPTLIKKDYIQATLQEKNGFWTPMDNIYDINLDCFEKIDEEYFQESTFVDASQSIGQPIVYQSSFNMKTPVKKQESIDINDNLSFGDYLEFNLVEDFNGEYYGVIDYSKRELKKIKTEELGKLDVISTIHIQQEFYPTNKLPYKIFENAEGTDLCYITVKW